MASQIVENYAKIVESDLQLIAKARYGREVRTLIVDAFQSIVSMLAYAGYSSNINTVSVQFESHYNRIRNRVYGEEIRDAIKSMAYLCYDIRGINITLAEIGYINRLDSAYIGKDIRTGIVNVIRQCCKDVKGS